MKKKILSLILIFALSLTFTTGAYAQGEHQNQALSSTATLETFEKEAEYAKAFLANVGIEADLTAPIVAFNTGLEKEIVSFTVNNTGYIIVNLKDFDVPEYSLTTASPFSDQNATYIYNGPLSYYKVLNELIQHVRSREEAGISELIKVYDRSDIGEASRESLINSLFSIDNTLERKSAPTRPSPYESGHYCGVDGSAILLAYWDDNYDDNIVPTEAEGNETLQDYLIDKKYLADKGLSGPDIVDGNKSDKTTGLKTYLKDHKVSKYKITDTSYSFKKCKTQIDKGYILLAGTDEKTGPGPDGKYNNHWIIPYDYTTTSGKDYLIINDGWGNDDIKVSPDSKYYPWGLVYMYK